MRINNITSENMALTFRQKKPISEMRKDGIHKPVLPKDKDERYNTLQAMGGIAVLGGLGIAIAYQVKSRKFFSGKNPTEAIDKMISAGSDAENLLNKNGEKSAQLALEYKPVNKN